MDNQMMLNMMMGMLEKMSDDEIDSALLRVKGMVSPSDYEKICKIVQEKRGHGKN